MHITTKSHGIDEGAKMKLFNKVVILDRILLTEAQWAELRSLTNEVVEFSGLKPDELVKKLAEEQRLDPGAVCFTQLALEQVTETELNRRVDGADAVITCWTNIPDTILRSQPQLRYVGFWTNLVEHRINLVLAKELGIKVTYIPDYGTTAVAEYTFAMLMELLRKPAKQAHDTRSGKWPYELLKNSLYVPTVSTIPYHCLEGMKLGIIGYGRIGERVARIARGFGMEISYHSRKRRPEIETNSIAYRELDELFAWSDVVTIHLSPYTSADPLGRISIDDHAVDCPEHEPANRDVPVISRKLIGKLRDGAIFINTSAGRLVDEEALLDEAESGRIRVAVDVYKRLPERKRIQKICAKHPESYHLFTYRGGWFTQEAITSKGESLLSQMKQFLSNME